jgi:hypothetical protein
MKLTGQSIARHGVSKKSLQWTNEEGLNFCDMLQTTTYHDEDRSCISNFRLLPNVIPFQAQAEDSSLQQPYSVSSNRKVRFLS